MSKYREVYDKVLPESKRLSEKPNIVLSKIVRPLCILATLPFLNTNIRPTTITKISVLASLAGFGFLAFGRSMWMSLIGWAFFFLWVILDGVDGDLARYKDQTSAIGELWDSFGGYVAMVLTYLGTGMAAFFDTNRFEFFEPYWFLVLGGATAVISIFPRLMVHKKREVMGSMDSTKSLTDKKSFGLGKTIALNFISLSGLFQIIFLCCILLHTLNIFICFYFVANTGMMLISLRSILKE